MTDMTADSFRMVRNATYAVYLWIKCKKTYQITTPCKSDEVTHPKQHKLFFSGIMW